MGKAVILSGTELPEPPVSAPFKFLVKNGCMHSTGMLEESPGTPMHFPIAHLSPIFI